MGRDLFMDPNWINPWFNRDESYQDQKQSSLEVEAIVSFAQCVLYRQHGSKIEWQRILFDDWFKTWKIFFYSMSQKLLLKNEIFFIVQFNWLCKDCVYQVCK